MSDWWIDRKETDEYVARLIVDRLSRDHDWDGNAEFDSSYYEVPVVVHDGVWWVADSQGRPVWSTHVAVKDTEPLCRPITRVGDLAFELNLQPSSLARKYGWDVSKWSLNHYAAHFEQVAAARLEFHKRHADERNTDCCDRCHDTVRHIDAGFSPALHGMRCECGGQWVPLRNLMEEHP